MKFFLFLVFSLYFYFPTNAFATTLKEAISLAYKNSEQIFIKMNQKDLSTIDFHSAIMKLFPKFGVKGEQVRYKMHYPTNGMGNLFSDSSGTGKILTIDSTATLSFYKTIPNIIARRKNVIADRYAYNEFLENFGLLFISKYMDVIYYKNAVVVYSQMNNMLEKKKRQVVILNKYGTAKKDKVTLTEAQYYENKANEINTQSLLDKSKIDYKILTGVEPVDLKIPNLEKVVLPFKNKKDYIYNVLQKNSKLLKTKEQLLTQKIAMITRNLNLLPDIYATYSYVRMPSGMLRDYSYVGLGVSLEINGADDRLGNARKGYKEYRIACLNKSLTEKEVEQDASYAWDQYFATVELVKATKKALKAISDSLKEIKVSVSSGMATFIDQMDIENRYLNANLKYLEAEKSLVLAYYKLISLTGVGYIPVV